MSQAVSKIKSRIKTVSGAYKVTSAMKLVSNVKLKQWKNKMLSNKEYIDLSKETLDEILLYANNSSSVYLNENNSKKRLFIVVSSTLGLCGSYNANIFKIADTCIEEKDTAIIIGKKGIAHFENGKFEKLKGFENYTSTQDKILISSISDYVLDSFNKGLFREIHLIYSEYKNSMVFIAKDLKVLPLDQANEEQKGYGPILEPNKDELIKKLVPIYIKSLIFSKFLESSVCEEAARSNAMENATNNASDILEELNIEFNKARQNAITQEIVEIVAASKSV